jgi:hypothetical protein
MQKISPIKERISQYVDYIGLSEREFYTLTGIGRGTLGNNSSMTEKTLSKLFAKFPDLNKNWVYTGQGKMLNDYDNKTEKIIIKEPDVQYKSPDMIRHLIERVVVLEMEVKKLKDKVKNI